MGLVGTDSKLKYVHLVLLLLVTGVIILGLVYLNETSQRVQLQQKVLFMEKQAHHVVAERSIIRTRANNLQEVIENQKNEIKNMQEIFNTQLEEQEQIFWIQKNDLLKTISTKDEVIINLKRDYELLKKHFDSLNLQMEEFEKNQSRLLEKFSTQSTQCMKVINLVSELCNVKNGNKSRKVSVSNSTNGIFLKRTTVGEEINRTQEISLISNASSTNSTEKPSNHEGRTTNKHFTEFSGDINTTASLETFENTTQMISTDRKQNEESNISAEFEERMIEDILEGNAKESNDTGKQTLSAKPVYKGDKDYPDSLEDEEDIITLQLQEKKSQDIQKHEALQTKKKNDFIDDQNVALDHRHNTKVLERQATQKDEQMIQFSNNIKNVNPKINETDNMNDTGSMQDAASQELSDTKVFALKNETAQVKENVKAINNIYDLVESMEDEHSARLNRSLFINIKKKLNTKKNKADNMNDMESMQDAAAQESIEYKVVALKNETAQVKENAKPLNNHYDLLKSMQEEDSAKLYNSKQTDHQINITVPNLVPDPITNGISAEESDLDTDNIDKNEKESYSTRSNDGKIIINIPNNKETTKEPIAKINIPEAIHKKNTLTFGDRKNNNYKNNKINQL
ncbi:interaptin [Xenopus laevis]|uniref:Interaptin n=2 Tax=Xenopus laevis TaxID=8355 RepID=A0A1L8GT84_XENLA|nr:interaptin [Xenopus laevis]XP_018111018.1 interaptin [Xenopus laevis]OCT87029.1 hypothetical protein XELAEV_18020722mg [Xenopus laevis]